jgi:dihydroorotate dehydrogenase electron transfer subunit
MVMLEAEFLPGRWLQTYAAPWIASGARAGQFVHVRTPDQSGLVLRRPFSLASIDRRGGRVAIEVGLTGDGTRWLAAMRPGDRNPMYGPFGRGYEVDSRTRHLLLIGHGPAIAGLRALADDALHAGRQVAVLFGASTAAEVYPSTLLPDEVEYVVATEDGSLGHHGSVLDLVPTYEAWADQAFASGPSPMLTALARLSRGREARMGVARLGRKRVTRTADPGSTRARRKSWLQVSVEQTMGCAAGTCLGCVVTGIDGPQRACREGPVFSSDELTWPDW